MTFAKMFKDRVNIVKELEESKEKKEKPYKRHLDNSIDISIRMDEVQARYDKLHAEIHGYEYVPRKTLNDETPKYEGKEKELFESMQAFFDRNKF